MSASHLANVQFADLTPVAQLVFYTVSELVDDEGRYRAAPHVVRLDGRLLGLMVSEVAAGLVELVDASLIALYHGDEFLFLPDHFSDDWRGRKKYWSKSDTPLPDLELLDTYPQYLQPLRMISRRSVIQFSGEPESFTDRRGGPRYPELWPELHDSRPPPRMQVVKGGQGWRPAGADANSDAAADSRSSPGEYSSSGGGVLLQPQEMEGLEHIGVTAAALKQRFKEQSESRSEGASR